MPTKDKEMPFEFILDHLYPLEAFIRKMFGTHSIYIEDKIYLAARQAEKNPEDNGLWIGTEMQHHESLMKQFPSISYLNSIPMKKWLLLPESADDFEESAIQICELIKAGDPRVGVLPKKKKKK